MNRTFSFRKLLTVILVIVSLLILATQAGCFGDESSTLTTYFGDSTVVAARYYVSWDRENYESEELPADRIDDLVEKLDSMKLKKHGFHTDYFWGGVYGIELELEDGNYITYDGTKLELRSASRVQDNNNSENNLRSTFFEVTDCNYWNEMKAFFPSIDDERMNAW